MFNYMLIRSHLCHNYWMLIYCIIGSTLLYWAYLVCFCIYCASSAHTHPHLCIQIVLNKIGYELFCCSYTLLELYSAIYFLFFRTVIWKYADVIRILIDTHVCDHTDKSLWSHRQTNIYVYIVYILCPNYYVHILRSCKIFDWKFWCPVVISMSTNKKLGMWKHLKAFNKVTKINVIWKTAFI